MDEYKGSNFKEIGPITLGAISTEASTLLTELIEKFEREQGRSIRDVNGYQALYWACRWSGLIRPSNQSRKGAKKE